MSRTTALVLGSLLLLAALGWGYLEGLKRGLLPYNEHDTRREGSLALGDPAPDLELVDIDGVSRRLSEFHTDKPAVFIFGSYT